MTLSEPQETAFDAHKFVSTYVYIYNPPLIVEAPITGNSSNNRAYTGLTVGAQTAGFFANIKNEMYLEIDVAGKRSGGSQRIRNTALSEGVGGAIGTGRAGVGRVKGAMTLNNGGVARVYADYRPFIKAPYIDPTTGTQYKDETQYTTDAAAQPPVASFGTDRLIITDEDEYEFTLNALGALPSFAIAEGASLSSYLWDIGDGNIESGLTTDSSLVVTFPRGARYVSLRVTDSNGIQHTTHRLYVVARPEDCIPAIIDTHSIGVDGSNMTVVVQSKDLPLSIPRGAKVLVADLENYEEPLIGYTERFTGWLADESFQKIQGSIGDEALTLKFNDVAHFLKTNHLFPQSVNIAGEELGGWYQMPNANITRLMHYVLQWHTNILNIASIDFSENGDLYPFNAYTTSGQDLWSDLDTLAEAFAHQLTCDSRGVLRVLPDPHVQPTEAQASTYSLPTHRNDTVVTTFDEDRYTAFSLNAEPELTTYWLEVAAIIAGQDAVVSCIAPSNAPNFGNSSNSINNWLAINQDELNVRAGNYFAAIYGNPIADLTLDILNPAHIIEPAERLWVKVAPPAYAEDRYNVELTANDRWTVEQVDYTYGDFGRRATYRLIKENPAPAPAATSEQTLNEEMVQAWAGFDTSINPTTGLPVLGFNPLGTIQDIRINGCVLEKLIAGTWVPIGDIFEGLTASAVGLEPDSEPTVTVDDCELEFGIPTGVGSQGEPGEPGQPGQPGSPGLGSNVLPNPDPEITPNINDILCFVAWQMARDMTFILGNTTFDLDHTETSKVGTIESLWGRVVQWLPAWLQTHADTETALAYDAELLYSATEDAITHINSMIVALDARDRVQAVLFCALKDSLQNVEGVPTLVNWRATIDNYLEGYIWTPTSADVSDVWTIDIDTMLNDVYADAGDTEPELSVAGAIIGFSFAVVEAYDHFLGLADLWHTMVANLASVAQIYGAKECDDECGYDWCYEWDFTVSAGGWATFPESATITGGGSYVSSTGFVSSVASGSHRIRADIDLPDDSIVKKMEIIFTPTPKYTQFLFAAAQNADVGNYTAVTDSTIFFLNNSNLHGDAVSPISGTNTYEGGGRLYFNAALPNDGGAITIQGVRVWGDGDLPAFTGGEEC